MVSFVVVNVVVRVSSLVNEAHDKLSIVYIVTGGGCKSGRVLLRYLLKTQLFWILCTPKHMIVSKQVKTAFNKNVKHKIHLLVTTTHGVLELFLTIMSRIGKFVDSSRAIIQESQFTWLSILGETLCLYALWPSFMRMRWKLFNLESGHH